MQIRDATFDDFEQLLAIMHRVHSKSVLRGIEMNDALIQRNFVVAMHFDDGYARVIERGGKIVGGLIGIISDNHFGIRCAQDLFTYSRHGSDLLLRNFLKWADFRGARFVQITDLTNSERYHQLCCQLGLKLVGHNFVKVF